MKGILLFIQLLLYTLTAYSQGSSTLIGSWKVVSVFNGSIYFNMKTDSTFISPEMKEDYPDSSAQQMLISSAKSIYGAIQLHFEKNGMFKQTMDTVFLFDGQ